MKPVEAIQRNSRTVFRIGGTPALILFLVLLGLRIAGYGIPWIWVFSPLWIPLAFIIGIILLAVLFIVISAWADCHRVPDCRFGSKI